MSRPQSSKLRLSSSRFRNEVYNSKNSQNISDPTNSSYEDMLVSRYLSEIHNKPGRPNGTVSSFSPYKQKFVETHLFPRQRPYSGVSSTSDTSSKRMRPVSAPVYKRPLSATYGSSRPTSAKTGKLTVKSLYRKQHFPIVCSAFKNGDRGICCRVTAPNFHAMLDYCTEKMGLLSAARRAFYADGTEIRKMDPIERDAEIYISAGENFKDPFSDAKQSLQFTGKIDWTVGGVVQRGDIKKKFTKPKLSKRMKKMLQSNNRRILVFRNGKGTDGMELVADANRFEDFLTACTAKLELRCYAKSLFDWDGNELADFSEVPILDQCLQSYSTPVLGPIWVATGEAFSPKGVIEFLNGLLSYTKTKLKEAKIYKGQLLRAVDAFKEKDENRKNALRSSVNVNAILSMNLSQVETTSQIVSRDIDDFTNALNRLKEQLQKLSQIANEEEEKGQDFSFQHIDKIPDDHRLIGAKGIRLKVYENGSWDGETVVYFNIQQMERGLKSSNKGSRELLFDRLLDVCSSSGRLASSKNNPSNRPIAKRLFNSLGREITDINQLEYDQEVWLSYGESFRNPFTFVLSCVFDKVRCYKNEGKVFGIREQLQNDDRKDKDRPSAWIAQIGFPGSCEPVDLSQMDAMSKDMIASQTETSELPHDCTFLIDREKESVIVYPELTVDTKKTAISRLPPTTGPDAPLFVQKSGLPVKDIWTSECQLWVLSKSGHIHSKSFPQLVLSATDYKLCANLRHPISGETRIEINGYGVLLRPKNQRHDDRSQIWRFTKDGFIFCESLPDLTLTYVGARVNDEESKLINKEQLQSTTSTTNVIPSGVQFYLGVCERIDDRRWMKAQKFALKQERMDNLGQWKFNKMATNNNEWNKRALSWPVDEEGNLNEEYDWPMEGFLLPYAPPMTQQLKTNMDKTLAKPPLRLMVLKNGVRDIRQSVGVVGPDLTNMRKDLTRPSTSTTKKLKNHHHHNKKQDTSTSLLNNTNNNNNDLDELLHCDQDLTVLKLEFILFLERATSLLDLPFAARRLFDENGREFFTLQGLERDQLVYVSCGEIWSDPNLSKAEQQRRYLLSNLAADVGRMKQFVELKNTKDLVLAVESLSIGSGLIIERQARKNDKSSNGNNNNNTQNESIVVNDESINALNFHDKSHAFSEEWLNKRKWPWERKAALNENSTDGNYNNHNHAGNYYGNSGGVDNNNDSNTDYNNSVRLQRFGYKDDVIFCESNPELVLGVEQGEGRIRNVLLMKRRLDDVFQRWTFKENGLIVAKCNPSMVLSVSMTSNNDGNKVLLAPKKMVQFGKANQKWKFDDSSTSGFIQAYATSVADVEITAANLANVCTAAVMGANEIDQEGFYVEIPLTTKSGGGGEKNLKLNVCTSCARSLRGRFKMERIADSLDFACDMASNKQQRQIGGGSFKCLNGKVDLSTHEADHTLDEWMENLEKLKAELSVRSIAQSLNAARTPYTVKILAYKNNEGRLKSPEFIVGSSIAGILDQATHKLNMNQAARRLYTEDGTLILDVDDLIEWVREDYVNKKSRRIDKSRDGKSAGKEGEDDENENEEKEEEEEEEEKAEHKVVKKNKKMQEDRIIFIGNDPNQETRFIDSQKNYVYIPNPKSGKLLNDGILESWRYYANKAGLLFLQIWRPIPPSDDGKKLSSSSSFQFSLIAQIQQDIPEEGEYELDATSILEWRESGGVALLGGDVFGFYCPDEPIIGYEVVKDVEEKYLYCDMKTANASKGVQTFRECKDKVNYQRAYSMRIKIRETAAVVEEEEDETEMDKKPSDNKFKSKKNVKESSSLLDKDRNNKPSIESIIAQPIEVWISSGEAFVKPSKVESKQMKSLKEHDKRSNVSYELEKEKHILRQQQARLNPEEMQYEKIDKLTNDLIALKQQELIRKQRRRNALANNIRLHPESNLKRILVYPNGETIDRCVYVWGDTLEQLLDHSTTRLNLRKAAKYLFGVDGRLIENYQTDLERDQIVCAASSKRFLKPKQAVEKVQIKARWGRDRKKYGAADVMDFMVAVDKKDEGVGLSTVDPYANVERN